MFENIMKIEPATSTELVLSSLARKSGTGAKLTNGEVLLGMSASVIESGNRYGPGPANMPAPVQFMPESLKGALASARV